MSGVKREFVIERQGKTAILYQGLLDLAHAEGIRSIETMVLQIPEPDNGNVAICRAVVTMQKTPADIERAFTGLGDASPGNVAKGMQTCLLRMAETRAKARALRDAVNVGAVCLEELPAGETHTAGRQQYRPSQPARPQPATGNWNGHDAGHANGASSGPTPDAVVTGNDSSASDHGDPLTAAQRRMIEALVGALPENERSDYISDLGAISRAEAAMRISSLKVRRASPGGSRADADSQTDSKPASKAVGQAVAAEKPVAVTAPIHVSERTGPRPVAAPITSSQRARIEHLTSKLGIDKVNTSGMTLKEAQEKITELTQLESGRENPHEPVSPEERRQMQRTMECLKVIGFTDDEQEQIINRRVTARTVAERIDQWVNIYESCDAGQIEPGKPGTFSPGPAKDPNGFSDPFPQTSAEENHAAHTGAVRTN